ncbi:hypothetical protein MANES_11G109000v8 [Manihot esculenta]|uniref:Uncharacterized protein n=1 Tax=Manihot esculenta TaxID=3983 RepID=A0ACB7GZV8_MANES|nr:hypothetical protein MANES_11G109000v8 [Manihot esculenta]
MGCSGSKFNPGGKTIPARLRPLLPRRFEEMRRWRHGGSLEDNDSAIFSKKELLIDGFFDTDNSSHPHDSDRKSISSLEDHSPKVAPAPESDETAPKNKIDPNKTAETTPLQPVSVSKDVVVEAPLPKVSTNESNKSRKENDIQQDRNDEDKEKVAEMETTETAEDENWAEVDGRLRRITKKYDYPGSPSFRFYCIESLSNKDDGSSKCLYKDVDDDASDKKSEYEDCLATSESTNNSDAGSETKTKKKGRKVIRLRRVIPKGRSGAVMNLLNVKSCYTPTCVRRRDNAHILAEKAVA